MDLQPFCSEITNIFGIWDYTIIPHTCLNVELSAQTFSTLPTEECLLAYHVFSALCFWTKDEAQLGCCQPNKHWWSISDSSGRYLVNGAQPGSASGSSAAAMKNYTMDLLILYSNSDKKCVLQLDIMRQALIHSSNNLAGRRAQK